MLQPLLFARSHHIYACSITSFTCQRADALMPQTWIEPRLATAPQFFAGGARVFARHRTDSPCRTALLTHNMWTLRALI